MRILYHHRTLAEDAQGVHIEEIIRALRRQGHTVHEVSLVRRGESGNGTGGAWRSVARLARGPAYEILEYGYNLPATRTLAREIRRFRPHLLYERYALSTIAGALAAGRLGVPHLLEVNAPLVDEKKRWDRLWLGPVARRVERFLLSHADRVLAVSAVLAERLAELGAPRERIRVVRNGADGDRFHPDNPGSRVRERHGLDGKIVLGFVGWFRPWHAVDEVVEAMAGPELRALPLHLLLVGDGPARESIESCAREHGILERLTVTGPVSRAEVPDHVAAFDVALQPAATPYACPMKIPEYLAGGKPVVAPDQPNLRELVRDGREGLLFPPHDRAALSAVLGHLARDEPLRAELGRNARRRVVDAGLLWSRNAERIVELAGELRRETLSGPAG